MSYLYDSLRDALGGKKFRTGIVIKDWSPNEVRAIYIMRDFILIADYLKQPKIFRLDMNEVNSDLLNQSRRGNLNNLLDNRHLSCLEEIYVDTAFIQYKDVIDLESYVQSMFNQASRLRYYGYVRGFNPDTLQTAYSQALINGNMDFTAAKNIGGFNYQDVGNKDWYKKYNLRPQWYAIDGEKGRLHTYFAKCEKLIGGEIEDKDKKIELLGKVQKIVDMFKVDCSRARDIKLLMDFVSFCKNCDELSKSVSICVQDCMTKKMPVKGLSKDLFQQAMLLGSVPMNGASKFLLDLYQKVGVFDEGDKPFEPDETMLKDGIYQLGTRLDLGLADALNKNLKKEHVILFLLSSTRVNSLPKGRFSDMLAKKDILGCSICDVGDVDGIINYVYGICGFYKEDFKAHINSNI